MEFVKIFVIGAVVLIIFCGIYPFIGYYCSLNPFPRLFLPPEYKEHLTMGEMVTAIQISSNVSQLEEKIEEFQPKLSLSSVEIEAITQENTRRNSTQQLTDPTSEQSSDPLKAIRISRISRLSIALVGMRSSLDVNQIVEDNISRRVVRWNPIVTYGGSLHGDDEDLQFVTEEKEWIPLPSIHQNLKNIRPKGILKTPPSKALNSDRSSTFAGNKLELSLVSEEDINDTLNPLFPETKTSSLLRGGRPDESVGWRKRKESYEMYRTKTPKRSLLSISRRDGQSFPKNAHHFEKLDEVNESPPQGEPKIRRHTVNSVLRTNDRNPFQGAIRRQPRHSQGNQAPSSQELSKQGKRYYSPPPQRYDERGNRIIELVELESPHHPIWVGAEEKDRAAYEMEALEKKKDGKRCGGGIYHVGLLGREEERMIGGKFKDIV